MRLSWWLVVGLVGFVGLAGGLAAQVPVPTLRIGVTAVEVDAVVTDRDGKHVSNLQASDFELLQDGKPQAITSFRFVPVRPHPAEATTTAAPAVPLVTGAQLREGHAGRVMAIVIDDLGVQFVEMARVRDALLKFIDRDMRPDDAVAVVMTSGGVGRLQQFTNDKAVLKETVARLRTNLLAFAPFGDEAERGEVARGADDQLESFQAGALGAVQNVVRGMRDMPGRKAVMFVSSGFALVSRTDRFPVVRPRLFEALNRLTDESNRSFVVLHTIDPRGLVNPAANLFDAQNRTAPTPESYGQATQVYRDSREGPDLLAENAGGLSFKNNDLTGAFGKALADQEGYYLLGYQPEITTFRHGGGGSGNKPEFHKIKVRVKRSGLHARTRSGFFGITNEEMKRPPRTADDELWTALASPFVQDELGVRMTPLFGHKKNGDVFRVLFHIDGQGLTFAKGADGQYRAPVEVLATLIDGRGASVEAKKVTLSAHTPQDPDAPASREAGFVFSVDVPAKEPGAYQLRVAVRDVGSNRTGTGYQFVRIPNLARRRLALSGIALAANGGAAPDGGAALRRFPASSTLRYVFDTYNAELDPTSHLPALAVRLRLYRDGALVVEDKPTTVDARPTAEDPERAAQIDGALQLSQRVKPGEYQLQLEVTDTRRNGRASTAQQWIDFTVAPQ